MEFLSGTSRGNVLLLHGGAPSRAIEAERTIRATEALARFSEAAFAEFPRRDLCEVVVSALGAMEDDPQFNAGLGGTLQSDRLVRVTAALMDGRRQSFSGVINALDVKNPSVIAHWLQGQRSRVITQPGVQVLAEQLHLPREDLVTEYRLAEWQRRSAEGSGSFDTVGCVARSANGELASGTSTGGRAFEFPGRVSDSATVAGTYASAIAAVSTTGIGEEIVDDALAARLETRCRDGMTLEAAARRTYDEAIARNRSYGLIAVHQKGSWVVAHTTPSMTFVVRDESGLRARSPISS